MAVPGRSGSSGSTTGSNRALCPNPGPILGPVVTETPPRTGFSGMVQGSNWPRPQAWARPDALDLGLDVLPGVSAALVRKLRPLGIGRIGDLLFRRPRRYESAA